MRAGVRGLEASPGSKIPPLAAGESLVLGSANVAGLDLGAPLPAGAPLPRPRPPLPLRLLVVSAAADQEAAPVPAGAPVPGGALVAAEPAAVAGSSSSLPTSLDLGGSDRARGLQLVRARGPLEETLACFQMLGQMLDLPYRRDAIEKVLRDKLRRGLEPDLQLCGQIAAMLGLLVTGAKVQPSAATRLITPCLIP